MDRNARIESLRAGLRAPGRELQQYLQRPLTEIENARRSSIITEQILPILNQINAIENGFSQDEGF